MLSSLSLASCLLGLSLSASAQVVTQARTLEDVERGVPIEGDYTGRYRPQVHFSPPQYFMNDPNGLHRDADGLWHLYYQYNPTALVAGNQHWGHATSPDLYNWTNQPIALFPPNNETFVFSGSVVLDPNNTSGFFPSQSDGVVAIYTLAEYPGGLAGPQQQAIAPSYDGGYTFEPYEGNPVIPSTSSQFRDPQVTWYRDHWVMTIAYAQDFTIGIWTSPDLRTWSHASNFTNHGLLGLQYECPNLVRVPVKDAAGIDVTDQQAEGEELFVLYISINPGAPLGGSIGEYFPGTFNGTHFTPVDSAARIADFGKDNYATQFFGGLDGSKEAVSIAWASNWQYTQVVPTASEGWRSAMSLPRKNYLTNATRIGWVLASEPYDLTPVIGEELLNTAVGNETLVLNYADVSSNALYWEASISDIPATGVSGSSALNFTFSSPAATSNEVLSMGFYLGGDNPFFIDRSKLQGFPNNPFYTDKVSSNTPINRNGTWEVSGVIDRSLLEAFSEGGKVSATQTFFAAEPLTVMSVGANLLPEGTSVEVRVWALESTWS